MIYCTAKQIVSAFAFAVFRHTLNGVPGTEYFSGPPKKVGEALKHAYRQLLDTDGRFSPMGEYGGYAPFADEGELRRNIAYHFGRIAVIAEWGRPQGREKHPALELDEIYRATARIVAAEHDECVCRRDESVTDGNCAFPFWSQSRQMIYSIFEPEQKEEPEGADAKV